jgi:hypothetical protein
MPRRSWRTLLRVTASGLVIAPDSPRHPTPAIPLPAGSCFVDLLLTDYEASPSQRAQCARVRLRRLAGQGAPQVVWARRFRRGGELHWSAGPGEELYPTTTSTLWLECDQPGVAVQAIGRRPDGEPFVVATGQHALVSFRPGVG